MNKVILASIVSDSQGMVQLKVDPEKTDFFSMERRVSKRATLDGGSVFDDYGFSHTDREFTLVANMNKATIDAVNYMVETFTSIMVSTVGGLFLGTFQDTRVKGREMTIKILIKEKLA